VSTPQRQAPSTLLLHGLLGGIALLAVLLLLAPTVVVIVVSFTNGYSLKFPPPGYSLRWYEALGGAWQLQFAAVNSLKVASAATLLSVLLGVPAAMAIARSEKAMAKVLDSLFMSPLILPARDGRQQALVRLHRRRREAAAYRLAGCQRHQRLGVLHGAGHAVHHRHRQLPAQCARQAGQRCTSQHDDLGTVLVHRPFAQLAQRGGMVLLHLSDAGERPVQRTDARQATDQPVGFHHLAVPGRDALRDGNDGDAVAQQAGTGQRRFRHAQHRHRQHLAQASEAGVAEGRDDHRVVASVVLGRQLRGGIGTDQRLEARLDVRHAERRG